MKRRRSNRLEEKARKQIHQMICRPLTSAEAEVAVFQIKLTREKILTNKLDLERKTRTDEDIRRAVARWIKDPIEAESRYGHISAWDVSRVTDMSQLFIDKVRFNEDLSLWDTGNVTDMNEMFAGAYSFTSDLSRWDTRNVINMKYMFQGASSFTSDLSRWNTGKVKDMSQMFAGASSFTSDLSRWNTGKVKGMDDMFDGARWMQKRPLWYKG